MVSSMKSITYKKARPIPAYTPVIEGNFPAYQDFRELSVFKFNRFLASMLALSILISMVSYSMVAAKESAVVKVHNQTNEINYENLELQNKVDQAKSFYNINDKIAKISFLKKPDKVLEVKASTANPVIDTNMKEQVKPVSGY